MAMTRDEAQGVARLFILSRQSRNQTGKKTQEGTSAVRKSFGRSADSRPLAPVLGKAKKCRNPLGCKAICLSRHERVSQSCTCEVFAQSVKTQPLRDYGGAHATVTSDASGKFRAYASTQASWYYFTLLNIEGVCEGQFSVESDGYRASAFTAKYFNWGGIDGLCSSTPIQRSVELDRDG